MTTTAQQSPVTRAVTGSDGIEYVVTVTAAGLMIREKGRRSEYGPVSYGWLYLAGGEAQGGRDGAKECRAKGRVAQSAAAAQMTKVFECFRCLHELPKPVKWACRRCEREFCFHLGSPTNRVCPTCERRAEHFIRSCTDEVLAR